MPELQLCLETRVLRKQKGMSLRAMLPAPRFTGRDMELFKGVNTCTLYFTLLGMF